MSEHHLDRKTRAVFALIITSDTRNPEDDETGNAAKKLIEAKGHKVASRTIIPNDAERIRADVEKQLEEPTIQVIITSGGTGIGSKDKTVDTLRPLLEKDLPGFGELFRHLSYEDVGAAATLSRSIAGIAKGKVIFCLPGSKNAVRLALGKIILPSIGHMLWELNRR
jgi:molybdenum cofactor biosynthesis protein B